MDDRESEKRAQSIGLIERILSDGVPCKTAEVVEKVFADVGRKRGVQRLLETDRRFVLVKTGKTPLENMYTLRSLKATIGRGKASAHPAVSDARQPRNVANISVRRDYVEKWTDNPFELLARGEALAVDVSNLLGRRCGGKPHEAGACPDPVPLWALLRLLAQSRSAKAKSAFLVDASTRHHVQGREGLESLVDAHAIREVPASYTADSKLLAWADENKGVILTDDYKMRALYADLYPWVNDATRFIGHMVDDEARHKMSYVRKKEPARTR